MKNKFNFFIPKYTYIPLLSFIVINLITYYGSRLINNNFVHHGMASYFDSFIPFCSFFIVFYFAAYVQWILGYCVIARESKEVCYKYLSAEIIAKLLSLIIFIVYPTTMNRADISGNSIFDWLVGFIYNIDAPVNLFPSIHCLESWMCFRGALVLKKMPKWFAPLNLIIALFVFASTVFIKQHVLIDILGGIIVVEIGLFIAGKFNTGVIFEKLNKNFSDNI